MEGKSDCHGYMYAAHNLISIIILGKSVQFEGSVMESAALCKDSVQ